MNATKIAFARLLNLPRCQKRVVPTVQPKSHDSIETARPAADTQLSDRRFDVPRPEFRAFAHPDNFPMPAKP